MVPDQLPGPGLAQVSRFRLSHRIYAPADKRWPQLAILLVENPVNETVFLDAVWKRGPCGSWMQASVPIVLLGDLAGLIVDGKEELSRRKSEAGRNRTKGALGPRKGPKMPREKKT